MKIKYYKKALTAINSDIKENNMFTDVKKKAIKAEKALRDYIKYLNKQQQLIKYTMEDYDQC